jgi:heavy metal sensor kinase
MGTCWSPDRKNVLKAWPLGSVRGRLTVWHTTAVVLTVAAMLAAGHRLLARRLESRVDESLRAAMAAALALLADERAEGESQVEAAQSVVRESLTARQAVAVLDAQRNPLAERPLEGSTLAPSLLAGTPTGEALAFATHASPPGVRVRSATQRVKTHGHEYLVVVAESLREVDGALENLRSVALAILPLACALALLSGWLVSGRALGPVLAMSRSARRLGAANLQDRLEVANPDDELGHLAQTLNELLARLESAFGQQRRFMEDASHELRTPLSIARTAASMTLHRAERTPAEYREALDVVGGQMERATRLVDDLFLLARVDAGQYPVRMHPLDLGELVIECAHASRVLANARSVTIAAPSAASLPESPYRGDEELLRRMILNLLANAVAHTPDGGAVAVALATAERGYRLDITDTGAGVPPGEWERVFERFHRVDGGGRTRTDGAGLGLPIARWVAEAHGGRVTLERSDASGSTFAVDLPAVFSG